MRVIGLSRSRWHYAPVRPLRDAPIRERLKALAQARPRFGYKRLHVLLKREGLVVNHKRVYRLYREERLTVRRHRGRRHVAEPRGPVVRPTQPKERWGMDFIHDACVDRRRFRCLTMVDEFTRECLAIEVDTSLPAARVIATDSKHTHPVAPNVLDRDFGVRDADGRRPVNRVWVGDITYLTTREGGLYLAIVLDLGSRRVIGWAMRHTLEGALTRAALTMALSDRQPESGVLHHSDRGSQYAAGAYQDMLTAHGMGCSMSRVGNCWDNAVAESFFATLKRELADDADWATREEARTAVFEYIEVWYNQQRRHSSLGYLSPAAFELQHESMRELTTAA